LDFKDQPDYNYLYNLLSQVLEIARKVDNGEFDWVKARAERIRKLKIRPLPGPVADTVTPPTVLAAIGIIGKRLYTDSVPDIGQTRARRPPTLLYRIADATGAANMEAPGDCTLG
jgi:hypothetical protein